MMFKKIIKSKDIILKKLELEHASSIYKLRQDKDVNMFLPNKFHESLERTREYIKKNDLKWDIGKTLNYAILSGNVVAGAVMLCKLDFKNKNCELGIWLGKEFWHRGIAKEACNILLDHAFKDLGMERVHFYINRNNIESIRFFEKLGAKKEGLLRKARLID